MGDAAPSLYLFGAGHVGQALVTVLAPLPFHLVWLDTRDGVFPGSLMAGVDARVIDDHEPEIREAPAGSYFLAMTHSHAMDYDICEKVLQRGDFAYLGLIGSRTKRRKFEQRLQTRGYVNLPLDRLTCPIGVADINSKEPAAIAVGTAAQLLQCLSAREASNPVAPDSAVPQPAKIDSTA